MGGEINLRAIHATASGFHGFFTTPRKLRAKHVPGVAGTLSTLLPGGLLSKKPNIKLTLTDEQKKAVKNAIGKDAEALELSADELEERIAPAKGLLPGVE